VEVRVKEPLVVTRAEKAVQVAEERESRLQPDTNTQSPPLICTHLFMYRSDAFVDVNRD
jgi:hypothetical protein